MKKPITSIAVLVLIVISLALIRTFVANNIATSGVMLSDLEQKISNMKTENAVIAEKLYSQAALSNISSKAIEQGFASSKESIVVSSSQPVAFKK